MQGFSSRNLKYMRAFSEAYPDEEFVQQVAAQIPWFHNCLLLDKIKDTVRREWYIRQTITNGWSRAVLVHQIETGLYQRQVRSAKTTNFPAWVLLSWVISITSRLEGKISILISCFIIIAYAAWWPLI
jgi:hypothetical protein